MLSHLEIIIPIGFYLYILITPVYLILDNRDPSATIGWILFIVFLPVAGFVLYLFIGKNSRIHRKHLKSNQMIGEHYIRQNHPDREASHRRAMAEIASTDTFGSQTRLSKLLFNSAAAQVSTNNAVEVFLEGRVKFDRLLRDIRDATESIHLAYYIWSRDSLTEQIRKALFEKAAEGVDVRILVDDLGRFGLGRRMKKLYRANGIQVHSYARFLSPTKFHYVSYRNHRKIAIIDNKIGYTGGMNMSEEYVNLWRDTHLRIRGDAVRVLQQIFLIDWQNTTGEELSYDKYCPPTEGTVGNQRLQLITSGPISDWYSARKMYFELICNARKHVKIQSPFFIPDQGLIEALENAAMAGVNVEIMLPKTLPDSSIPNWVANTYFKSLLEAGCRIHIYEKSPIHAKTITVDGNVGAVGTANFDIRSFVLDYELMVVYYDSGLAEQMESAYSQDLEHCRTVTLEEHNAQKFLIRLRNSVVRLFAPLM